MRLLVLITWLTGTTCCFAQTPSTKTFEAASIRPPALAGGPLQYLARRQGGPGTADPGHLIFRNTPLLTLLADAWNVQPSQIVGPAWLSEMAARPRMPDGKFDVEAVVPPNTTREDARLMLQNLLTERFGLVLHQESRVLDVWNLELSKGASLTKTNIDPDLPAVGPLDVDFKSISLDKEGCEILDRPGILTYMTRTPAGESFCYSAKAQTMSQLAEFLAERGLDDKPVIDKTGLNGAYDFKWTRPPGIPGAPAGRPIFGIEDELSKQLGIKVTAGKGPVDVLVIDKLNKAPTEN